VRSGSVHLLRHEGRPAAMFTLTWEPPFDASATTFPPARKPIYMGRLAVAPEWLANGSLVGVRCVRRAIEIAEQAGADALRSEANPDLARVRALLDALGFEECAAFQSADGRRAVHLQKTLAL